MDKFIGGLLTFVLLYGFGLIAIFFYAVVLHDVWAWFVVPALHVPTLSWRQCVGLLYVASFAVIYAMVGFDHENARRSWSEIFQRGFVKTGAQATSILFVWGGAAFIHAVLV